MRSPLEKYALQYPPSFFWNPPQFTTEDELIKMCYQNVLEGYQDSSSGNWRFRFVRSDSNE